MSHHWDESRYGCGIEDRCLTVHDRETRKTVAVCLTAEAQRAALRLMRLEGCEELGPPFATPEEVEYLMCGAW